MTPRLELRAIRKRYGSLLANDAISLRLAPGEIHAVLGENGAGKSTLMKIVNGALQADSGEILWEGKSTTITSPAAARRLGIGMVYQHFSLFETITVAENVAITLEGPYDLPALASHMRELSTFYGLEVDPRRIVQHLSLGERQQVEILRSLMQRPRLLILDEPTSVLAPPAVQRLFAVLRRLAAEGCSILYISHKLEEIRELCDSATVLRAGRVVATAVPRSTSAAELARMMVGHELPDFTAARAAPQRPRPEPQPRLSVEDLSLPANEANGEALHGVSLELHGGEILGIAGVSGNGQGELLAALAGERASAAAQVLLAGEPIGQLGVAARRARGIAFVPEERLGRGCVPAMSLAENTLLTANACGLVRRGLIARGALERFARSILERFAVHSSAGADSLARSLSGGNLQRFLLGREISLAPRVLLVAQPTWGVDVAGARMLRQCLLALARSGTAVLVVSEELEELFEICDRIAVMHRGRLSAARARDAASIEEVGLLLGGSGPAHAAA